MKTLLSLLLLSSSIASFGQTKFNEDYLVCYGQVWGFLKYFHPEPGNCNWDTVLINAFPNILECESKHEFNHLISKLLNRCGSFVPVKRSIPDSLMFNQSFSWIDNDLLDSLNRSNIEYLKMNKPKFQCKYITNWMSGQPIIQNEKEYDFKVYDEAIQYLSITRYWNIINYFCPNRDIIPTNWTLVYKNNLQNFLNARTYEAYYFAVSKLTTEIRDGHGFIRASEDPFKNYRRCPFNCVSVSDGYFIDFVFQDSLNSINLQKGDKITLMDGKDPNELVKAIGNFYATSNDYCLYKSTRYLKIFNQDSIALTVERGGELISVKCATLDKKSFLAQKEKLVITPSSKPIQFRTDTVSGKDYCYLNMESLQPSEINKEFYRKLSSTSSLIIDVRNYPNGTLFKLSKYLLKGKTKFARFKEMNFDYPSSFLWSDSQVIGNKKHEYKGQIFVLVDYVTMSQAEYTVMALQQHAQTLVIGGQTAGADGNISEIPLPYGIKSVFSGLGVFYMDRTPTQQIGIKRDYEIIQDRSYVEGRDLIMEKAIELMREK